MARPSEVRQGPVEHRDLDILPVKSGFWPWPRFMRTSYRYRSTWPVGMWRSIERPLASAKGELPNRVDQLILDFRQRMQPSKPERTLERSALDRWITFDPEGYLDLSGPEVTYFDPMRDKRVDGLEALRALLEPIKQFKGTITEARYEMIDPKVQQYGDVALLTYNLTNYGRLSGAPESVLARWNSSEMYARVGGTWKLVHSHWSYTKPDVKSQTP